MSVTKIEQVTAAIESLIAANVHLALAQAKVTSHDGFTDAIVAEINAAQSNIRDARSEVVGALNAFLKPTLRVVGK
jgi:hypothetical protein